MGLDHVLSVFPVLETERLILRKITSDDAEDYCAYYSHQDITQYLDWSGPASVEHANDLIASWETGFGQKTIIPWGIALKSTNRLIGTISHIPVRGTFESIPLFPTAVGFELSREYWNKGLLTEGLQAVIGFSFGQLGASRIQAEVYPENEACLKLLTKLGFQQEGILRKYLLHEETQEFNDIMLLSLLNSDLPRKSI